MDKYNWPPKGGKKNRRTYQTFSREEIKNAVEGKITAGIAAKNNMSAADIPSSSWPRPSAAPTIYDPQHPQHRTFKRMLIKRRARQGRGSAAGAMLPMRMEE